MILDEVVYIEQFPKVFKLHNGIPVDLDMIGTLSLFIHDSLLIVTARDNEGMWSFFSLPEHKYLGKYFTKGNGPNEFLSVPWVENQSFFEDCGQLFAIVYDFHSGKSYKMNISETLQNKSLSMIKTDYLLPRTLFNFSIVDTTTFFCKEVSEDHTQQIRYILSVDGKKKHSRNLEKLNSASVQQGKNINILSTGIGINTHRKRIVEVCIALNQINLYSLDDFFGKTICVGSKQEIDNIGNIQLVDKWERAYTYMNINTHPNFFGALYLNEIERNYQQGSSKNPIIQFFDWDGNPLAEVQLDRMITSYAIDFIHGFLYTLNYNAEDEIYRYDIHDILENIEIMYP